MDLLSIVKAIGDVCIEFMFEVFIIWLMCLCFYLSKFCWKSTKKVNLFFFLDFGEHYRLSVSNVNFYFEVF